MKINNYAITSKYVSGAMYVQAETADRAAKQVSDISGYSGKVQVFEYDGAQICSMNDALPKYKDVDSDGGKLFWLKSEGKSGRYWSADKNSAVATCLFGNYGIEDDQIVCTEVYRHAGDFSN
jgi:hypothetical protein